MKRGSSYRVKVSFVISEGLHGILELDAHRLQNALALRLENLSAFATCEGRSQANLEVESGR